MLVKNGDGPKYPVDDDAQVEAPRPDTAPDVAVQSVTVVEEHEYPAGQGEQPILSDSGCIVFEVQETTLAGSEQSSMPEQAEQVFPLTLEPCGHTVGKELVDEQVWPDGHDVHEI